ncbi:hypothetical protein [Stackebrandtia nassauensis]|uniref:hypothetical protein n=1 Tax=Stackebrandtia nassauensis TaxID=283811 RepID=UPI0001A39829|nr:hypothetical protein [Stackebrandtia nassauensis]
MSNSYGAARVRAVDMRSKHEYARQRFLAGIVTGLVGQMILAFLLGLLLLSDSGLGVRIDGALISSLIATPGALSAGFAIMLKDDARAFGGGIVAGAVGATLLWLVLSWIF